MRTFLCLTFLFGLCAMALAAVSVGNYKDINHPGKCVVRPDLMFSPGVHKHPEGCARVHCSEGGFVEMQTCGIQAAGPGCKMGDYKDPEGDYPACCEREIICEANDSN